MATKSSIKYLRSHRKVIDANYAQASTMRMTGMKTCQIMKFFAMQCEGYRNIGFVLKDLYNRVELEEKKETTNEDAEGAIGYFIGRTTIEPTFYFEYEVDIEGRLENIFWMDSVGQMDYKAFGDVLVFDSTYNTNKYHKPLVVLAGVKNDFGTIIFGPALLSEKTTEAYDWILGTLVKANGGKKPISVITDGDKSMRQAIEHVLPNARHGLCTFHLKRNAETGTNKCSMFTSMFAKFMKKAIPMEEFEEGWHAVVASCGLDGNDWVKKMYAKRSLWAETLLRECFFVGMRSTSWCEQMNAFLKRYIKPNMRMYQFVKIHALALDFLREKESKAHHEIEDTFLMLSTELLALEQHAAEAYTRNIFVNVRKHLGRQGLYDCFKREDTGSECLFYLAKYRDSRTWVVEMDKETRQMKCSCKKFEWKGLPCAHMFRVMVVKNLQKFPQACIMKRWTMNAKEDIDVGGSLGT
ncbi:protein FAR1-RELATED SEQUENCE 5-like [Coffea eugenioides]|uniref:protein FAR1-RELATED SEQUENCE 5-like n=1 Tax=Coffea eugenioides TaxID=49369 RepID=UPI000F60D3BF|nr:protein FAR1-RELATED SEQUENCE 5-like [Coffea eugenioides]